MGCVKCDREVYDGEMCIFHCEKDGWDKKQIKKFQDAFSKIELSNKDEDFIFPNIIIDRYDKNQVFYKNVTFSEKLIFENESFNKSLTFINCTFKKEVEFINCEVNGGIDFTGSIFEFTLKLESFKSMGFLNFSEVTFNEVHLNNNKDQQFNCNFYKSIFNDTFEAVNNKFIELNFEESTFLSTSEIKFEDASVGQLVYSNYTNYTHHILFKDITVSNELLITDIVYTNENFQDLKVFQAKKITINNVILNEQLFDSTVWGNINDKRFRGTKKTFRELKKYAELSKNFIDASAFYSLEMRAKKDELWIELNEIQNPKICERCLFYIKNILMYQLYEKTSNYSEDWIRPLVILIAFGMLSYIGERYGLGIIILGLGSYYLYTLVHCLIFNYKINSETHLILFSFIVILIGITMYSFFPNNEIPLSKYISPFGLFKGKDDLSVIELLSKVIILLLGYQTILAIKANIRNK